MSFSVPSTALSGLHAASSAMAAHAHNLANLGTEGFRRSTTVQTALPQGGVQSRWTGAAGAGHAIEADLVGQLQAKNHFLANLAVFRSHDAMTGALLDAVG
jgi:flagellar basal body rod protein FlgF